MNLVNHLLVYILIALGITSKLNWRSTAWNRRFWLVAIVLNNDNRPTSTGRSAAGLVLKRSLTEITENTNSKL